MSWPKDGVATTVAIGVLAYVLAAVVHELVGHGSMCVALGGHAVSVSSLFLDCDIRRPLIAVGSPGANIITGLSATAVAYALRNSRSHRHMQVFSWILGAYSLFFATGYALFSAVTGLGDWAFLLGPEGPTLTLRLFLGVFGSIAILATFRLLRVAAWGGIPISAAIGWYRMVIIYVGATLVAFAGAALDPAGIQAVIRLPPAAPFAGLGLLWLGHTRGRTVEAPLGATPLPGHRVWLAAGLAAATLFIGLLGPGVHLNR